jgi:hypothetical protein
MSNCHCNSYLVIFVDRSKSRRVGRQESMKMTTNDDDKQQQQQQQHTVYNNDTGKGSPIPNKRRRRQKCDDGLPT